MTLNEKVGHKFENNVIQDGGAAIYKFTKKNLNNLRTVGLILTKFGTELRLDAIQTAVGSKQLFFKMAADEKLKFTKNRTPSKRFVLYA